jgi:hypothetical protein
MCMRVCLLCLSHSKQKLLSQKVCDWDAGIRAPIRPLPLPRVRPGLATPASRVPR